MRILVVCSGNICRSPMATGLLRRLAQDYGRSDVRVFSAGTLGIVGSAASDNAVRAMSNLGIDISDHRSAALHIKRIEQADVILVMEAAHAAEISRLAGPDACNKVHLLTEWGPDPWRNEDVFDPIGRPIDAYEECLNLLTACCEQFALQVFQPTTPTTQSR